jgi:hypothetical protein
MDIKVEAVRLETGTFVQRITAGERSMLVPLLREKGQAERLSAELRALLARLMDSRAGSSGISLTGSLVSLDSAGEGSGFGHSRVYTPRNGS